MPGVPQAQLAPLLGASALPVIYRDDCLLVLNKPSGMLSVPGKGELKQCCLSSWAQAIFPQARAVHRLDMGTSGLMVMAMGALSQRRLSQAFALRQVGKHYEAIVAGRPEPDAADEQGWSMIDLPIQLDWSRRPLRVIDRLHGKPSQTRWRRVQTHSNHSLIEIQPQTGRSHQIRVHLQALGHPVVGDRWYASGAVAEKSQRLLLHASRLRLPHPATQQVIEFECPSGFASTLFRLRSNEPLDKQDGPGP